MAQVTGQSIPAELVELYQQHMFTLHPHNNALDTVAASPNIFSREPYRQYPTRLQRAQLSAEWLADNHEGGVSAAVRTNFIAERRAEIMAGIFPAAYWYASSSSAEYSRTREPVSVLDTTVVDPLYHDPNRQSSVPNYQIVSAQAALPAPQSGPPNASPGWFGDVQSLMYADRWHSEYLSTHYLGQWLPRRDSQMMWIKVDYTLDLSASHRPNAIWAAPNVSLQPGTSPFFDNTAKKGFRGRIKERYRYRFPMSPAATPWAQSITDFTLLDFTLAYDGIWYYQYDSMAVLVSPVPPFGRYFSRNDWCRCWLTANVTIYRSQTVLP